jgi:N utilization substance protein A
MMNPQEMLRIVDSIARDRGVERDVLIGNLEQAMVSAARKHFNSLDAEEFQCTIDPLAGTMELKRHGEPMELAPETLGRIAAQTFKQVLIQRNREDERQTIYDQFIKRVGDIVTGTVQRYEGGAVVMTLDNRAEGFMPRSEQIPGEQFHPGDRIRVLVLDCRAQGNQVKIVLSRAHPDFIKRLFELEVPEVGERVIELKAMAREAGYRTKVAVSSIDSKVDAVGACVGVRGSRIRNIVDELNGEKIDIVRWNESSQILIQNALKPAEVVEVSLCFELGRGTVVVNDDQLSLAIGKRGQNVRLAARLTGWDIDILTPVEFGKGLDTMAETLKSVEGVTDEMLDRLAALGMISVFDIEEVGAEVLIAELEVEESMAQAMVEAAAARAKVVAEEQAREKEEAEQRRAEEEEAARRLLSGEMDADQDVDADTAAAAILGLGSAGGDAPTSGDATPSETGPDETGPDETGPDETGPSETGPGEASDPSARDESGDARDLRITAEDDERAAAILSGDASDVDPTADETPVGPGHEHDAPAGYDPGSPSDGEATPTTDTPSPSDAAAGSTGENADDEELTGDAVQHALTDLPRERDDTI